MVSVIQVCPSCLRCKSCNMATVYKFVGNLPLCRGCFKLRQRGNFCPLCQRCYEDNDFDTKVSIYKMIIHLDSKKSMRYM